MSLQLVLAEDIEHGHVSWKAVNLLLSTLSPWPIAFWAAYLIGRWCVCRFSPRLLSDVLSHSVSESAEVLGEASSDPSLRSTHRF
jgi:hypothetical protein